MPLKANSLCTVRNSRIAVSIITIFAVCYNFPKIWYCDTLYVFDHCTKRVRPLSIFSDLVEMNIYFETIYVNVLFYVILFFVPLVSLGVTGARMVQVLRVRTRELSGSNKSQHFDKENNKITQRILLLVTCFFVLELPSMLLNLVVLVLRLYTSDMDAVLGCMYVISGANSFINFYIYFLTGRRFRKILIKLLTRRG
jgi:hypothetical protein